MVRWMLVFALAACAHAKPSTCPEKPRCLTTMKCQYDSERQCDVCVCSDAYVPLGAEPPPGQPPFQR
jgi:hypothetical protein